MKNLLIGTSFLLSSFIAPTFAEEKNDFYLSVGGGIALPNDYAGDTLFLGNGVDFEFDTNKPFFYSVGFGKKFNDYRVEFNYANSEVEAQEVSLSSGGISATGTITPGLKDTVNSYMVYGYKDFPNKSNYTPYAGIGLGIGTFSADDQTVNVGGLQVTFSTPNTTVFSYALKGGIDYQVGDNSDLYTELTYQNFGSYEISEPGFETANWDSSHYFGISAGLRFFF